MGNNKVVLASEAIELMQRCGWPLIDCVDSVYRFNYIDNRVLVISSLPGHPHLIDLHEIQDRTIGLNAKLEAMSFEQLDKATIDAINIDSGMDVIIDKGKGNDEDVQTILSILSGLNRLSGGSGLTWRHIEQEVQK